MVLGFAWVACCCLGISQTSVARFTHKLQKCEKEAKKMKKKLLLIQLDCSCANLLTTLSMFDG